jgi:hypothetical protein
MEEIWMAELDSKEEKERMSQGRNLPFLGMKDSER